MVASIELSTEDKEIQKLIQDYVTTNNGKVDLLDIANGVSKQGPGYSRQRVKEWTILLINDGVLQDGPSRMITIGE